MVLQEQDISKKLGLKKVFIPVLIGLTVTIWLLFNNLTQARFTEVAEGLGNYVWVDANKNGTIDFNLNEDFKEVTDGTGNFQRKAYIDLLLQSEWTWKSYCWLLMALLMMVVRDAAYMWRLRVLSDKGLSWKKCFNSIMLWEFASTITPSVVGGSGVAIFILNREGLRLGRSTAIVMVTAMLDELFYIIIAPLVLLTVSADDLFIMNSSSGFFGIQNTQILFWIGYGFLFLLTVLIVLAIFVWPTAFNLLLTNIFSWKLLKKWKNKASRTGKEIIVASKEFRGRSILFWTKGFFATFFSWTARFWVVNFLVLAFTSISVMENMLIYARQLVMWVIMLISPTPGSSGVAEIAFTNFLEEFTHGVFPIILVAIIWRLISYYLYLVIGALILPRWLRRTTEN